MRIHKEYMYTIITESNELFYYMYNKVSVFTVHGISLIAYPQSIQRFRSIVP